VNAQSLVAKVWNFESLQTALDRFHNVASALGEGPG
jgi:hypothetical protein